MAVALGHGHVLDHGETHGLRRTEAEGTRVADVQRNDFVALTLELLGSTGQASSNLVFDVAQAFTRANLGFL